MTTLRETFPAVAALSDAEQSIINAKGAFLAEETARLNKAYTREELVARANTGLGKYDSKVKTKADAVEDLSEAAWQQTPLYRTAQQLQKDADTQCHGVLYAMQRLRESVDKMRREVQGMADVASDALTTMAEKGYLPTSHYAKRGAEIEVAVAEVQAYGLMTEVASQASPAIRAWANGIVKTARANQFSGYPSVRLLIDLLREEEIAAALAKVDPEVTMEEALVSLGDALENIEGVRRSNAPSVIA